MPRTRFARRLSAGAALVLTAVCAVLVLRGLRPPFVPASPLYRQKGPGVAPVVIAEFSDFQCPACRTAVEPLKSIESLFGNQVRVIFKHHPWSFHRWAKDAALAAECAGRSGKFWEFHDVLYARQLDWADSDKAPELFKGYARDLGLEPRAFASCLKDPATATLIDADLRESERHWVRSTPTFFINGYRLIGARQLRDYGLTRIERILRK